MVSFYYLKQMSYSCLHNQYVNVCESLDFWGFTEKKRIVRTIDWVCLCFEPQKHIDEWNPSAPHTISAYLKLDNIFQ